MAVFTKIDKSDVNKIEENFNLGIVRNYHGIKKGIENTNYFLELRWFKFLRHRRRRHYGIVEDKRTRKSQRKKESSI